MSAIRKLAICIANPHHDNKGLSVCGKALLEHQPHFKSLDQWARAAGSTIASHACPSCVAVVARCAGADGAELTRLRNAIAALAKENRYPGDGDPALGQKLLKVLGRDAGDWEGL